MCEPEHTHQWDRTQNTKAAARSSSSQQQLHQNNQQKIKPTQICMQMSVLLCMCVCEFWSGLSHLEVLTPSPATRFEAALHHYNIAQS